MQKVCAALSRSVMYDSLHPFRIQPTRLLCPWDSPGKNTGVGCHALLQGIYPTQGSNPGLLHCSRILYRQSHQGVCVKNYLQMIELCLHFCVFSIFSIMCKFILYFEIKKTCRQKTYKKGKENNQNTSLYDLIFKSRQGYYYLHLINEDTDVQRDLEEFEISETGPSLQVERNGPGF